MHFSHFRRLEFEIFRGERAPGPTYFAHAYAFGLAPPPPPPT